MTAPVLEIADRIRNLHAEAQAHAQTAVARAIEAGGLLANAKATLPHGEFQAWVSTHCGLNLRTARRYMRAHEHRNLLPQGLGLRAALNSFTTKRDTVTTLPTWLPDHEAVAHADGPHPKHLWLCWREGEYSHAVCIALVPDDAIVEATRKPIRSASIGQVLQLQGLANPDAADWRPFPHRLATAWREWAMTGAGHA